LSSTASSTDQSNVQRQHSLQFFNGLHIHHIFKYFYSISRLIRVDADARARQAALNIIQLFKEPAQDYTYFDNYRYGGIFSYADCLSDIHAMSLKQIIKRMLHQENA